MSPLKSKGSYSQGKSTPPKDEPKAESAEDTAPKRRRTQPLTRADLDNEMQARRKKKEDEEDGLGVLDLSPDDSRNPLFDDTATFGEGTQPGVLLRAKGSVFEVVKMDDDDDDEEEHTSAMSREDIERAMAAKDVARVPGVTTDSAMRKMSEIAPEGLQHPTAAGESRVPGRTTDSAMRRVSELAPEGLQHPTRAGESRAPGVTTDSALRKMPELAPEGLQEPTRSGESRVPGITTDSALRRMPELFPDTPEEQIDSQTTKPRYRPTKPDDDAARRPDPKRAGSGAHPSLGRLGEDPMMGLSEAPGGEEEVTLVTFRPQSKPGLKDSAPAASSPSAAEQPAAPAPVARKPAFEPPAFEPEDAPSVGSGTEPHRPLRPPLAPAHKVTDDDGRDELETPLRASRTPLWAAVVLVCLVALTVVGVYLFGGDDATPQSTATEAGSASAQLVEEPPSDEPATAETTAGEESTETAAVSEHAGSAAATGEGVAAEEPGVEAPVEPEPEAVAVVEPEPVPEPVAVVEPEPVAVVEPEAVAVVEPEPEPEPVAVAEPEPEAVAEPEPEPEPEPVVAPEPEPVFASGAFIETTYPEPFDFNDPWPQRNNRGGVKRLAYELRTQCVGKIVLTGHASAEGSEDFNLHMGQRRADFVKRILREKGIDDDRLVAKSAGSKEANAPAAASNGNRRVTIRCKR